MKSIAYLCKDHRQLKDAYDYIVSKNGEFCDTYDEIYESLFVYSVTGYYKLNQPIFLLCVPIGEKMEDLQQDLQLIDSEWFKYKYKDLNYWLYYRMNDNQQEYADWDKYEIIDFNKMMRGKKLKRIIQ